MQFVEIVLYPIIFTMDLILQAIHAVTASYGVSIILLSLIVYGAITPLRKIALRIQQEEIELQKRMAEPLREAKAKYKGEAHFNEIERIYKEFNYHPIKSVKTALGLAIQVPFLLAGLLLLMDYPGMHGVPFLMISDLGAPDHLLPLPGEGIFGAAYINLLPLAMLGVSLAEASLFQEGPVNVRVKSSIVSFVIFLIVYPLASAIVLYWTCNNIWSLIVSALRARRNKASTHHVHGVTGQS